MALLGHIVNKFKCPASFQQLRIGLNNILPVITAMQFTCSSSIFCLRLTRQPTFCELKIDVVKVWQYLFDYRHDNK